MPIASHNFMIHPSFFAECILSRQEMLIVQTPIVFRRQTYFSSFQLIMREFSAIENLTRYWIPSWGNQQKHFATIFKMLNDEKSKPQDEFIDDCHAISLLLLFLWHLIEKALDFYINEIGHSQQLRLYGINSSHMQRMMPGMIFRLNLFKMSKFLFGFEGDLLFLISIGQILSPSIKSRSISF